jgi:hypothetical protein
VCVVLIVIARTGGVSSWSWRVGLTALLSVRSRHLCASSSRLPPLILPFLYLDLLTLVGTLIRLLTVSRGHARQQKRRQWVSEAALGSVMPTGVVGMGPATLVCSPSSSVLLSLSCHLTMFPGAAKMVMMVERGGTGHLCSSPLFVPVRSSSFVCLSLGHRPHPFISIKLSGVWNITYVGGGGWWQHSFALHLLLCSSSIADPVRD